MIKVFKWLWDKAEEHGREQVLADLHSRREYHHLKAEIAHLKGKYEPEDEKDSRFSPFPIRTMLPMEHGAISGELDKVLNHWYEVTKDGR